jgi:hypothetical protein
MKNSHTLSLINEAFEKVQEFSYKRYINELNTASQKIHLRRAIHLFNRFLRVNQILEKLSLQLMYKSVFEELENNSYNKMGKWSSVGTLLLALKNSGEFDRVYNLLSDEDSKATFDWFIRYRVAYSFLGELAREIFPSKITKAEFYNGMNSLKIDSRNGLINVQNFIFESGTLETAQTWVFEQYNLEGRGS